MNSYGEIIAKLRKENNMTQAELGEKLNVSYQAVSKWERGTSQPDFDTIVRLSKLFNVPLEIFKNDSNEINYNNEYINTYNYDNYVEETEYAQTEEPASEIYYCESCGAQIGEEGIYQRNPILCYDCYMKAHGIKQSVAPVEKKNKPLNEGVAKSNIKTGFWVRTAIFALILIVFIPVCISLKAGAGLSVFSCYLFASFIFQVTTPGAFISEFFLDSFGRCIRMPGVIFSLDFDGILFLITYKFIIAPVASFLIATAICIGSICLSIIMSPFVFPFFYIKSIYNLKNN